MFSKNLISNFLKTLENIEYGVLTIITPDNKKYIFGKNNSHIQSNLIIHNWNFLKKTLKNGDIGFAECYRDQLVDCDNLPNLLIISLKNDHIFDKYFYANIFRNIISKIKYYRNRNTIQGSKKNIHHHYDIGNNFYSLWLDKTMTYSSGIFNTSSNTLYQAQLNKYNRILNLIQKKSGKLLEIGCGWGGFIEHALEKNDFQTKGITISQKQHSFAQERLKNKALVSLEDYRHQQGKYDYIVSIEMFEAVGEKYWSHYFNKIKSLLHTKGKAIIQTITIEEKYFEKYKKTIDMIRTFIFPGGMLPSFSIFHQQANKAGLIVKNKFHFGTDYVKTLKYWLTEFENNIKQIQDMNFDEKFIRIWRFYLSACIAEFFVKRTDVIQIELTHG